MIQKRLHIEEYVKGVLACDKVVLGRAISLIESNAEEDLKLADTVMNELIPHTGNSIRIGITGVPGAGKSTFIETFGNFLTEKAGKKLAVLAIDPTSKKSKGSILGDKTRMEKLASSKNAFIRPSPTGKTLGGVAANTREVMLLCEASGYEVIIIETVGVGQSESTVKEMVDFFLLLVLAGMGDELQGIKKGIIEMADLIAVNKADGDNKIKAEKTRNQLGMALHLFPLPESGMPVKTLTCSALDNTGIEKIWEEITSYEKHTRDSGFFHKNRKEQHVRWLHQYIKNKLESDFFQNQQIQSELSRIEKNVSEGIISPLQGSVILLNLYRQSG